VHNEKSWYQCVQRAMGRKLKSEAGDKEKKKLWVEGGTQPVANVLKRESPNNKREEKKEWKKRSHGKSRKVGIDTSG